jgi:peptide/nickel transport system substrate-binding protein
VALLVVVAACSGDGGSGEGDEATDASTAAPEEGTPKPGGTLTMAVASDIDTLDPMASASFNLHARVGLVYNRLLTFATGPDIAYDDQVLVGELADRWEMAPDGLVYTFHLREDVRWQDVAPVAGRPLVARDVVATFERIRRQGFQRYMLENVTSIEAADDHTVVLRLVEPFAPLLRFMANHHMWILPEEATDGRVDPATTAIGTGPFLLGERRPNIETVFRKNPTYFQTGLPYLDEVRAVVIPDQAGRIAAFRAEQADILTTSLSPQEADALRGSNPDANYEPELSAATLQLYVNGRRAPFDDIRVRRAISMAIDREAMGAAIYGGGQRAGPVSPTLGEWALSSDEVAAGQPFDPDGARALLAEAGFPNGLDTTMMVTNGYGEQVVRMAQWVVQDLSDVGIRARIEPVEYVQYIGTRWPRLEYDIGIGPQTPFLEVDEWLRAQHATGAARNWFGVSDPLLDRMLEQQTRIIVEPARVDQDKVIQRYLMDEVVNPIQLWSPAVVSPQQGWVKGWHPIASYGFPWMPRVWLDR